MAHEHPHTYRRHASGRDPFLTLISFLSGPPATDTGGPAFSLCGDTMTYIFQFLRILSFCLLGELLHFFVPLPIPASIYGLTLLLLALKTGIVKLEQVKQTGSFLTGIFPLLFIPGGVGVMELWNILGKLWLPIVMC